MNFPKGPDISTPELFQIFMTNPFDYLRECFKNYGDLFSLNLGNFGVEKYNCNGKWVFISNPHHLKKLFNTDSDTIKAGAANDIQFQQLLPGGSVVIDGREHLERRRIVGNVVQGQKIIREYTGAMCELIDEQIGQLPKNEPVSLSHCLRAISNKIIGSITFGEFVDEGTEFINSELSNFGKIDMSYEAKVQMIDGCCRVLEEKIEKHKGCPVDKKDDTSSIFSLLLHSEEFAGRLPDEEVRNELLAMLIGGADTTATTMSWIFTWILSDENICRRVRDELSEVLQGQSLNSGNVDRLHYLDCVIREGCRISPVLFNSSARLLNQDIELEGYTLPRGTMLASCAYLVHMRPDNYLDPERFDPERFKANKPDPYKWVPFGGGIRRCLGMSFALYEMKVVIAEILQKLDLELIDKYPKPQLQGSFFGPEGGVKVIIHQGLH